MARPSLGDWNSKKPIEIESDAEIIAERLAWSAIDSLTAGRVAYDPITVRPQIVDADGAIRLTPPVYSVEQIRIAGVVLPTTEWRFDEPNILMRLNAGTWLADTDLTLASTDTDVLEVDYYNGWRPGKLLVWAAAELAAEFYRAASGDKKCRLPKNVTAITRQGVSFEMSSPIFDNGRTGIHEIDVILARYNPSGLRVRPVVASPESISQAPRRISV